MGEKETRRLAMAIALLGAVVLHGQTTGSPIASAAGTGSIRGRVLAAETDTPLRNARVELEDDARRVAATVLADREGRFAITSIGAGMYRLAAAKSGYVKTSFVASGDTGRPSGTPIRVTEGATIEGLDVRLAKAGAIAGRILDSLGDPIIGARVTADSFGDGGRTSASEKQTTSANIASAVFRPAASSSPCSRRRPRPLSVPGRRRWPRGVSPCGGLAFASTTRPPRTRRKHNLSRLLASEERSNIDFSVTFPQLPNDVIFGDVHAARNLTVIGSGGSFVAIPGAWCLPAGRA